MDFSWDDAKARSNRAKHGVSFSEAATVFSDPLALFVEDVGHAERMILIGMSTSNRLLLTVFIDQNADGVRIISARRATAHERQRYEEGI